MRKKHRLQGTCYIAGLVILLCIESCTTTHSVRTIGKGNWGAEASLGGPMMTNLKAPIPMPNIFLGGRYGVRDDMDISASYNLTAPITPGIGLDLILADHWVPIQPGIRSQANSPTRGWSLATGINAHLLSDFKTGFMAIPAFDIAAGLRYEWLNPFLGVSLALNFYRPFGDAHPVMLSPYLGGEFILSRRAAISIRLTFFDITYNYYRSQVEWVYLRQDTANNKAYALVGLSLGFSWDFVPKDQLKQGGEQ